MATAGSRIRRLRSRLVRLLGLQVLDREPGLVRRIGLRVLFLLVATGLLLLVCRSGQAFSVVALFLSLYVVAATLWVRGQYVGSRSATGLWTPPFVVSLGVGLLFVVLLVVGVAAGVGSLFIAGLVGTYFCAGYAVMRLRVGSRGRTRAWAGILAVLAAVALVGLLLLDHEHLRWLAATAVLLPIPLQVLTERRLRSCGASVGPGRLARWWSVLDRHRAPVGAVLLVGGCVAALVQVSALVMVVVLLAIVLLVVALVSSTYADIAMVIAVVALLGYTPAQATFQEREGVRHGLVALGDSYMSGEGAEVFFGAGSRDPHDGCRRAPTAWAAMAGQREPFDGLMFLACSGARTYNVNSEAPASGGQAPKGQFDGAIPTQLREYAEERDRLDFTPTMVVIGLGGNDAGFSTIGAMCMAPGNCAPEGRRLWLPRLETVQQQLRYTFAQVDAAFRRVPVVVAGYPDPIYTQQAATDPEPDCDGVPLSRADRGFVETLLKDLNAAVKRAAKAAGFHYLDMTDALADSQLQLCDPRNQGKPGLNVVGIRSVSGLASERFNPANWYHNSLHPNERGHAAMLVAFETWLRPHLTQVRANDGRRELVLDLPRFAPGTFRGMPVPGRAPDPPEAASDDPIDCRLYRPADGATSCSAAGYRWVGGQVRNALVIGGWGPVFLAVAFGTWLLALSFFARRPSPSRD